VAPAVLMTAVVGAEDGDVTLTAGSG
jgi:hypothetical protein